MLLFIATSVYTVYSLQFISIYIKQYCPWAYIAQTYKYIHIYVNNSDFQLWLNSTKTKEYSWMKNKYQYFCFLNYNDVFQIWYF